MEKYPVQGLTFVSAKKIQEEEKKMDSSRSLAKAGQVLAIIVALSFCMICTADALWVGGNIDVHNNTGQDAHDFHIKGKIKSTTPPTLLIHIGYIMRGGIAVPFPNFGHTITHAGGDLWDFEAEWSSLDVEHCEVGHFGLFFDATCRNVWVDLDGWWTDANGNPIGNWPILGFAVPPSDDVFRLQGDSGGEMMDTMVMEMGMMLMEPPGSEDEVRELFGMLNANQSHRLGNWMPVDNIPPNGMDFPADSFFDVFVEIDPGVPGVPPDQLLLVRTRAVWPDEPEGRWFFHVHQAHPEPEPVDIDIKPGSFPNSINLKSKGVIPVAVLGSDAFDAELVDGSTVLFGPALASPVHGDGHFEDVNGDGRADWVGHFRTQETGIGPTDTEARIFGTTVDGVFFSGRDSVRIVGGPKKSPSLSPKSRSTTNWGRIKSKY